MECAPRGTRLARVQHYPVRLQQCRLGAGQQDRSLFEFDRRPEGTRRANSGGAHGIAPAFQSRKGLDGQPVPRNGDGGRPHHGMPAVLLCDQRLERERFAGGVMDPHQSRDRCARRGIHKVNGQRGTIGILPREDGIHPDGLGVQPDGTMCVIEIRAEDDKEDMFRATVQALLGAIAIYVKKEMILRKAQTQYARRPAAPHVSIHDKASIALYIIAAKEHYKQIDFQRQKDLVTIGKAWPPLKETVFIIGDRSNPDFLDKLNVDLVISNTY